MKALLHQIREASGRSAAASGSLVELMEKLAQEVAANEAYVAELDRKADRLREIEADLVRKHEELANVQATLDGLRAQLASLKASIPA